MSPVLLLSIALQVACCVHVVRSGRPLYWVLILLMFSYIAVLIYLFAAVIPDMRNDPRARRGLRKVQQTINPGQTQRDAARRLDVADTPENRRRLAEEHFDRGNYAEAAALYEGALRGIYRNDPDLMLGLAHAQYGLGQAQQSRQTLEALIAANPTYRSHEGHLLYAQTLEDVGALDEALHEYEALAAGYPGEEGRIRHALLLVRLGRTEQARAAFENTLRHAAASPRHYQREQRSWIERAQQELRHL